MDKTITLFHGSTRILEKPVFGQGRINNDFGQGFYCTEDAEMAKECAVNSLESGFANRYTLEAGNLRVLDLNSPEYSVLNWMAVLVSHRLFSLRTPVARRAKFFLIDNFNLNVNAYDIVRGYRADDSYFDYAEAFLNNGITVGQLNEAMHLGNLGEQIVLKSQYAFSCLSYEGFEAADKDVYYVKRKARNDEANRRYLEILEKEDDGLFIQEIIRKGIKSNDPRLS